jgi:hypothetical protein
MLSAVVSFKIGLAGDRMECGRASTPFFENRPGGVYISCLEALRHTCLEGSEVGAPRISLRP